MNKVDENVLNYLKRAAALFFEFQPEKKDTLTSNILEVAKLIQLEELADREIKVVNRQMPVNGGSCG